MCTSFKLRGGGGLEDQHIAPLYAHVINKNKRAQLWPNYFLNAVINYLQHGGKRFCGIASGTKNLFHHPTFYRFSVGQLYAP
jgi:hypothetical protein